MIIGCSSKSISVIKLSFCQNDPLMGESFWQNNSLVTHILFELQSIIIFSPVANFGDQSPVLRDFFNVFIGKKTTKLGFLHIIGTKMLITIKVRKGPFWLKNVLFWVKIVDEK